MAINRSFTEQELQNFESDLLSVLRRDPDHQFVFDGKLKVHSSRYGCDLRAMNVLWDSERGDLVFVGAFIGGKPCIDTSKGYPVLKTEVAIPFRECYHDMMASPYANGSYLISKTRKAVIDKCVGFQLGRAQVENLTDGDSLVLSDFTDLRCQVAGERVGSISFSDGKVQVENLDGVPINFNRLSLQEVSSLGRCVQKARGEFRSAVNVYVDSVNKESPVSQSLSEDDYRFIDEKSLDMVYQKQFPQRVLHGVAKRFSKSHPEVFNPKKHSAQAVSGMMRSYASGGKFGFDDDKKRSKPVSIRIA